MLPIKYIPLSRAWGTPTPAVPGRDIGPTGTVWDDTEIFFLHSPQSSPEPFSPVFASLSLTIEDSSGLNYEIQRPIPVVIEEDEGCAIASFNEANIHASGDTMPQALANLKTYIGDVLDELLAVDFAVLGSRLRGDLAVLQTYIQKRNAE
jgi:predicted RNase H-like HicB family nuclease